MFIFNSGLIIGYNLVNEIKNIDWHSLNICDIITIKEF